jgi:hypothetical protein
MLLLTNGLLRVLLPQAVRLQELKFQMAVRDQIISEQRDVISNLWRILQATGLSKDQITDLARHEGILMQVGARSICFHVVIGRWSDVIAAGLAETCSACLLHGLDHLLLCHLASISCIILANHQASDDNSTTPHLDFTCRAS